MRKTAIFSAGLLLCLWCAGCSGMGSGQVAYVPPDDPEQIATGHVVSQDFLNIAEQMASSLVTCEAVSKASKPPLIVVQPLKNESSEYLNTKMYTDKVRTLLIKNGGDRVRFIDRESFDKIEEERKFKQRDDVDKGVRSGHAGADYFLLGTISDIVHTKDGVTTRFYRFSMRLTSTDSGIIAWEDEKEFKKVESRGGFSR